MFFRFPSHLFAFAKQELVEYESSHFALTSVQHFQQFQDFQTDFLLELQVLVGEV